MKKGDESTITFELDIIVEPDGDEYHAYAPSLKGLHVYGSTEEEALNNAMEAAKAYLLSLIKHGDPIPVGVIKGERAEARKRWYWPFPRKRSRHHIRSLALAVA